MFSPLNVVRWRGLDSFRKKILAIYETSEEALSHEIALHARFNVKDHPAFFNRANQLSTGFSVGTLLSDAHKQKIVQAQSGNGHALGNRSFSGKSHSMASREKMSQSRRGNQNRRGTHHSDVTKHKLSQANSSFDRNPRENFTVKARQCLFGRDTEEND